MINFGPVPIGAVLPIPFASYAGATGASITLTGLAVTDIEVYKGTSMTQRASDAGYALMDTDGIDIDALTGIHGFSIDTGDNTDAGFYASGSYYWVVVSAVTIDGQTVNFIAATFRCVTAEGVAGQPKVDTAAFAGAAATAAAGIPEVKVASLAAGAITAASIAATALNGKGDWNIGKTGYSLTQAFPTNFSALAITAGGAVTAGTVSDKTGYSLTQTFPTNFADLAITVTTGRVTVGTNADKTGYALTTANWATVADIPSEATISSTVWGEAVRVLTAGTNIALAKGTGVTGFTDLSAAQVNAEVVDALATDAYAEPTQGAPAATTTLAAKVNYLYKAWRNRTTQSATTYSLYADDAVTVDQKATVSDSGTVFDRGEVATGP